ncbi:MAG TPA: extracellular solute-binding protein [Acetivibrio sp.]|nr:extracellular solute-binding protein [Acetivibrio sp.]
MDRQSLAMNTADIEAKFIKGDYATSILGSWVVGVLENNQRDNGVNFIENVGVAMLPEGPKGRYVYLGGSSLAVFQSSQNRNEAIKLVKYLTSKEAQIEYCEKTDFLPVVKSAYEDPWFKGHRMRKVFAEQMNYAKSYPAIPGWAPAESYVFGALMDVWDNVMEVEGEYSPEKTMKILKEADIKINKVLGEFSY